MSSHFSRGTHTFSVVHIAYSLNECSVNTVDHSAHKAIVEVKSAPMILLKSNQLLNLDWCGLVFASHHTIYLCDLLVIGEDSIPFDGEKVIRNHVSPCSSRKHSHSVSCYIFFSQTHFDTLSEFLLCLLVGYCESPIAILPNLPRLLNAFASHFTVAFWSPVNDYSKLCSNVLHECVLMLEVVALSD
jgi:hypothetical protein